MVAHRRRGDPVDLERVAPPRAAVEPDGVARVQPVGQQRLREVPQPPGERSSQEQLPVQAVLEAREGRGLRPQPVGPTDDVAAGDQEVPAQQLAEQAAGLVRGRLRCLVPADPVVDVATVVPGADAVGVDAPTFAVDQLHPRADEVDVAVLCEHFGADPQPVRVEHVVRVEQRDVGGLHAVQRLQHGVAEPEVLVVLADGEALVVDRIRHRDRVVRRAVVGDQHAQGPLALREGAVERLRDELAVLVGGHQHRDVGGVTALGVRGVTLLGGQRPERPAPPPRLLHAQRRAGALDPPGHAGGLADFDFAREALLADLFGAVGALQQRVDPRIPPVPQPVQQQHTHRSSLRDVLLDARVFEQPLHVSEQGLRLPRRQELAPQLHRRDVVGEQLVIQPRIGERDLLATLGLKRLLRLPAEQVPELSHQLPVRVSDEPFGPLLSREPPPLIPQVVVDGGHVDVRRAGEPAILDGEGELRRVAGAAASAQDLDEVEPIVGVDRDADARAFGCVQLIHSFHRRHPGHAGLTLSPLGMRPSVGRRRPLRGGSARLRRAGTASPRPAEQRRRRLQSSGSVQEASSPTLQVLVHDRQLPDEATRDLRRVPQPGVAVSAGCAEQGRQADLRAGQPLQRPTRTQRRRADHERGRQHVPLDQQVARREVRAERERACFVRDEPREGAPRVG